MRIISFAAKNYRSITKTNKLSLKDITVLIGQNNEGKSNILNAFVLALNILELHGRTAPVTGTQRKFIARPYSTYVLDKDLPIDLRKTKISPQKSTFSLEFELNPSEMQFFKNRIGSSINGILPIEITVGEGSLGSSNPQVSFRVNVRGPAQEKLSQKSEKIAKFIGERVQVVYIPTIRTTETTGDIVSEILSRELAALESKDEYKAALKSIEKLQKPILDRVSKQIKNALTNFLPSVSDVEIRIEQEARRKIMRTSCQVLIDDGNLTNLAQKGDGVKSLAALGLIQHVSDNSAEGKQLILAVEEPESHLHPSAIHNIKSTLYEIAKKHQLLISTHCPLLVIREDMSSNIIVSNRKASSADSIKTIRDTLGIMVSDNLVNSELVLLVEGNSDKMIMTSVLKCRSEKIRSAMENGRFTVESLSGGTNLSYHLNIFKSLLCGVHCWLDNDEAGRDSIQKADDVNLLSFSDYNLATCVGMKDSEAEDLYNIAAYKDHIENKFGVSFDSSLNQMTPKWSKRVEKLFTSQGKKWGKSIENSVKIEIAKVLSKSPSDAINNNRQKSILALIKSLENKLEK